MQAGKTIAAKRERVTSDSERERARRTIRKRKVLSIFAVVCLGAAMIYLGVRAFTEWIKWMSKKEEVVVVEVEPSVEVIDDETGRRADLKGVSSRTKELIYNLEEEFTLKEMKITRAHIPTGKMREIDLEVEGFSGVIKVSTDRNAAVSAEDARRMIDYLAGQEGVEYIDVRLERKAYWK
ncbi:hypothetical protein IKF74_00335 [Candidatus Saccharibacteria bacterium]|nr:hypothetical protein [Candidatus Saccharibacteria bacterium]